MAIYNSVHTQVITFIIGKSESFRLIISLSRCRGLEYKPPIRHNIFGYLIDMNYKRYTYTNSRYIVKDSDPFDIYFIGDCATIKLLPLINIIISRSNS